MVVHQLDGDVAFGQQLDEIKQLARGDGAGAFFFDLGRAGGFERLVEIGGSDRELAVGGFEEEVRENWDGRFALDDGLSGCELAEELGAGDSDFEVAGRRCDVGRDGSGGNDGVSPLLIARWPLVVRAEVELILGRGWAVNIGDVLCEIGHGFWGCECFYKPR